MTYLSNPEYHDLLKLYKKKGTSKKKKDNIKSAILKSMRGFIWKFVSKYSRKGDQEDCYQAGVIGTIRAIEQYDPNKAQETGCSFPSYAAWWIRNEIQLHVYQYSQPVGRSRGCSAPLPKTVSWNKLCSKEGATTTIEDWLSYNLGHYYFDGKEEIQRRLLVQKTVETMKKILNGAEVEILMYRFGGKTHREIGELRKVSKQAIQMREMKAIEKIKNYLEA